MKDVVSENNVISSHMLFLEVHPSKSDSLNLILLQLCVQTLPGRSQKSGTNTSTKKV